MKQSQYGEGLKLMRVALAKKPTSRMALAGIAECWLAVGDKGAAIRVYEYALQCYPKDAGLITRIEVVRGAVERLVPQVPEKL